MKFTIHSRLISWSKHKAFLQLSRMSTGIWNLFFWEDKIFYPSIFTYTPQTYETTTYANLQSEKRGLAHFVRFRKNVSPSSQCNVDSSHVVRWPCPKNENKICDFFCFAHLRWCHDKWAFTTLASTTQNIECPSIMTPSKMGKTKNLIFYSLNTISHIQTQL